MINQEQYVTLTWDIVADGADRSVPGLPVYSNVSAFVGAVVTVVNLWSEVHKLGFYKSKKNSWIVLVDE